MADTKRTTAYIYGFFDPRPERAGELRYVGKTEDSLVRRLSGHKFQSSKGEKAPLYCWMRKLVGLRLEPEMRPICIVDHDRINEMEIHLIAKARSLGFDLLNVMSGGDGWSIGVANPSVAEANRKRIWTDDQRAHLSLM